MAKNKSTEAPVVQPAASSNKSSRLLALIKEGNQTKETLMAALNVNAAGLASQLSFLNVRGRTIAEIDTNLAEFPMKNDAGIFYMGTHQEYLIKSASTSGPGKSRTKTTIEAKEYAQKREDQASGKVAKARALHEANAGDAILAQKLTIAEAELTLASMLLAQAESGNFAYESFTIDDNPVPATVSAPPDPDAFAPDLV